MSVSSFRCTQVRLGSNQTWSNRPWIAAKPLFGKSNAGVVKSFKCNLGAGDYIPHPMIQAAVSSTSVEPTSKKNHLMFTLFSPSFHILPPLRRFAIADLILVHRDDLTIFQFDKGYNAERGRAILGYICVAVIIISPVVTFFQFHHPIHRDIRS